MKKIIKVVALAGLFSLMLFSNNAGASTAETVAKKAYLNGLYRCYTLPKSTSNKAGDSSNYQIRKTTTAGTVGRSTSKISEGITPYKSAGVKIYLPNGWTDEEKASSPDAATNCYHLMNGGDGFSDTIYSRFGKAQWGNMLSTTASTAEIESFLTNMGYQKTTEEMTPDNKGQKKVHLSYGYKIYHDAESSGSFRETASIGSQENVSTTSIVIQWDAETDSDGDGKPEKNVESCGVESGDLGNDIISLYSPDGTNCGVYYNKAHGDSSGLYSGNFGTAPMYQNVDTFMDELQKSINAVNNSEISSTGIRCQRFPASFHKELIESYGKSPYVGDYYFCVSDLKIVEDADSSSADTSRSIKFEIDYAKHNPGVTALKSLANASFGDQIVTESEKIYMYQHYVADVAGIRVNCDSTEDDMGTVRWFVSTTEVKTCAIETMDWRNSSKLYSIIAKSTKNYKGHFLTKIDDYYVAVGDASIVAEQGQVTISAIVDELNASTAKKLNGVTNDELKAVTDTAANNDGVTSEDDDDTEAVEPDCYSGAGSIGWILCPIIDASQNFVQSAYEALVPTFFVLDAELFQSGDGSGTYLAWQSFQGIANIAFTILFLFVIFSQLTGLGIDNYGIKKILPKLIAGAILINLSFVICQLVIDVSNIVGYGIKGIFEGIGSDVASVTIAETGTSHSPVVAGGITALLVGAIGTGVVLSMSWGVLIPIFLALIAIVVAILTVFVLLSVRKGMAVILVALSPVAFVAYMLPNTKKYYDKWFKSFQGVVLLFPICSMLVYGGQLVARIIISANAGSTPFVMALSAAVISIVPIYYIPKVLRSSMGMLSDGIMGAGRGIKGLAQKKYRESNGAQDLRRRQEQTKLRRAAKLDWHGNPKTYKFGSKKGQEKDLPTTGPRANRIARARAAYIKNQQEQGNTKSMITNFSKEAENAAVETYMKSAEFDAVTNHGSVSAMIDMMRDMSSEEGFLDDPEKKKKFLASQKKLASTADGKKALAEAARGKKGFSAAAIAELAKDGAVRAAVNDKDRAAASYLEEMGKGGEMQSYNEWASGAGSKTLNSTIGSLSDNKDLYSQSSTAMEEAVKRRDADGNSIISTPQLQAALQDPNLATDFKKREIIQKELNDRGVSVANTAPGSTAATTGHNAQAGAASGLGNAGVVETLKVGHNPDAKKNVPQGGYKLVSDDKPKGQNG